jgi:hypothetical protein
VTRRGHGKESKGLASFSLSDCHIVIDFRSTHCSFPSNMFHISLDSELSPLDSSNDENWRECETWKVNTEQTANA